MGIDNERYEGRDEHWDIPKLASWKHVPEADESDSDELQIGGPLLGDTLGAPPEGVDWGQFTALDRMFAALTGNTPPPVHPDALQNVLAEIAQATTALQSTDYRPPESEAIQPSRRVRLCIEELQGRP